ncbi:hypothetical protein FRZ67_03955 [Panacibacter ginsenosidivorans]|uniref:Uncharacterized protein n=1 Tax=Panacibacter ginsenosidivorans TaxID=1813871 RepID=A0A5B8V733_9BACT|nr:hypothetical protein [Panacibacter ginsenosidivorans]QEC66486.1 hypothetical protein FRZ67_03955 [Panacibacter ginsenosidivorans]
MENKEKLEELNKAKLEKVDEMLQSKTELSEEQHEKISEAKKEWQASWNKFLELLLVLEKLEI